jgi:hypothetical protein
MNERKNVQAAFYLTWPEEHNHLCEGCGLPWKCANGSDCELSEREGYCCQECHDSGPR